MNTHTIVVGLLALVIGLGGGYILADNEQPAVTQHGMGLVIEDMAASLRGKTGDEFDKAFLFEMTAHHEGAVRMAESALQSAKHQEIKDMAQAIISAQTSEINQMQQWGRSWYNR